MKLSSTAAILHDNAGHGEDCYLLRALGDDGLLDAVMDGVTSRRGDEASQAVAQALSDATLTSPEDVVAVLDDVNQHLYRRGGGRFFLTTASIALVWHAQLAVISAGDSPVLLLRGATAHTLASRTSGFIHTGITRALGASKVLGKLYRAEMTLMPGDRLILTTDGVSDMLTRDELIQIVHDAAVPEDAVTQIHALLTSRHRQGSVGEALRRDDWTAILRFFTA